MLRYALVLTAAAAIVLPAAADAQGLVGGAERGYRAGDRALGPIGGVVGGAVGAGVGTGTGALGHGPRCLYRHGHRYCRY